MTLADLVSDLLCASGGFLLADGIARFRLRPTKVQKRKKRRVCEVNRNSNTPGTCPNFAVRGCETEHCSEHCVKYCHCGVGVEP